MVKKKKREKNWQKQNGKLHSTAKGSHEDRNIKHTDLLKKKKNF